MEITSDSDELEGHSSRDKRSRFANFKTTSSSKHTTYDGSRSVSKKTEDFTKKFLKDSETSNKLVLNCSRSKICSSSRKGKEIMQCNNGVEELKERLNILETETEAMKLALSQTMEERKTLMNEIHQDFLKIHHRRHSGNQVKGLKFFDSL